VLPAASKLEGRYFPLWKGFRADNGLPAEDRHQAGWASAGNRLRFLPEMAIGLGFGSISLEGPPKSFYEYRLSP
jgi:hypothetical protein